MGNLLFKQLWSSISKSLMLLFNTIANKQQFPSTWKVSEIVLIHKENNKQVVSNYRLISLLNVTSKVLEKLMFDKMYSKVQKLLHNSQHGFRTKRSTITNIILYLHEIYLMYDNKNVNNLSSLYLDFKKAFDKVNHLKLIEKLSHTGFSGACLGLLKNYLSDRYQQVRIGHCISKLLPITSGVPQGSILGPLMFILYINDLPTVAMSNCFGYADDYKIVSDNAITLNIDSNEIWNWCSKNFMSLNLSKCKTLQFKGSMSVCMKKQNIPGTDLMKDLGLIVTNNLSWTEHAKTKSAKSFLLFKKKPSQ